MKFELFVENGEPKGAVFTLREGDNFVGRSHKESAIVLLDTTVSRKHLRVKVQGSTAWVENLSQHGTLLDDKPLERESILNSGQRLVIGLGTVLVFRASQDVAPETGAAGRDTPGTAPQATARTPTQLAGAPTPVAPRPPPPAVSAPRPASEPAQGDPNTLPGMMIQRQPSHDAEDAHDAPVSMAHTSHASSGRPSPVIIKRAPADALQRPMQFGTIRMAKDELDGPRSAAPASTVAPVAPSAPSAPPAPASASAPGKKPADDRGNVWEEPFAVNQEEDAGPHTQGLNPAAVEYLRQIQEQKVRNRQLVIYGGVAVAVIVVIIVILLVL